MSVDFTKIKFFTKKLIVLFFNLLFLGELISQQCAQITQQVCPPMIAPPALPCFGVQPPMLRQTLGPGITLNNNVYNFSRTDNGQADIRGTNMGLIRKHIARVPVLDRNGIQRIESSTNNPKWRYFVKYYSYNATNASRNEIAKTDRYTMNCWIPDAANDEMWVQQQNQFFRSNAYGCIWVNGADIPGQQLPIIGPPLGFSTASNSGTLCISNTGIINAIGNLTAIETNGNIRNISLGLNIPVGGFVNLNYNLNSGETLSWVTDVGAGITISDITMWSLGARSPDNICLYGTELPVLREDYFPGDRYGDHRDANGQLR